MISIRFIISFLFLIISSTLKSQETVIIKMDIEESYKKGVELMNANRYAEAFDYIFECQRSDSKNLDYMNRLGYCYFHLGNYREAKWVFETLLKEDSLNISALGNLASIANAELNYTAASDYFSQLIQIDSTNSYYFRQRALIAKKQKNLIAATAFFNKAHSLNENDIATIADLAGMYLDIKALDYAQQVIDKGMQKDSSNIRILQTNARVQNAVDDYPGVIRSISRAMELKDSSNYFAMMISVAYLKTDQPDECIYHLNRVVARERDSEYTHHYLAMAYEEKDDFKKAAEHYQIAIEKGISTQVPRSHEDLAKLFEKNNKYYKAYENYKAAHNYKPDNELLFHIAHNADRYYKDKTIAMRYYKKYLKTKDEKYQQYSKQRIDQLKEIIHQMTK